MMNKLDAARILPELFNLDAPVTAFTRIEKGQRANTFLVSCSGEDYILQEYRDTTRYQAGKKKYIFDLVRKFSGIEVPDAEYKEIEDAAYLLTKACPGKLLDDLDPSGNENSGRLLFTDFGRQLAILHRDLSRTTPPIGWISGFQSTMTYQTWGAYFRSEYDRIRATLVRHIAGDRLSRIEARFSERAACIVDEEFPCSLVWYDLNPTNFILDTRMEKVKVWLDPGAARFGPRLWDLAHAKLYLCKTGAEFESLLSGYGSVDDETATADRRFIRGFEALIKLDDLALGLDTNWSSLVESCLEYWDN